MLKQIILPTVLLGIASTAVAGTPPYRNLILGDNPIVYYELDETSGTTASNSATTGVTYDGTFDTTGGSITVNQTSFAQGGTAYDFGGGVIVAASALTGSLDEWTVEAWVNYDSAKTSASNFLSNDQGGWNDDVLFGIGAENGALGVPDGSVGVIQQGAPGTTRDAAGAPLAADEWHHVAMTGSTSAGALTLYIDGVLAASDTSLVNGVTFNGADGIGTANLTIGAARPDSADPGYRPYDGLLDEVAVYDKVLDEAAITSHFNAGTGPGLTSFSITEIKYAPDAEPSPTVTLTWQNIGAASYIAKYSLDMTNWDSNLGDALTDALDENTDDSDHITVTFDLTTAPIEDKTELFFRIEAP